MPPSPAIPGQRKRTAKAHAASKDAPKPKAARSNEKPLSIPGKEGGPSATVLVGDCREVLMKIPEAATGKVDLIFADPPFNWSATYDRWSDDLPHNEYLDFTYAWLDACVKALRPGGSLWVCY